ncbi:hypothetical protein ACKVEX_15200 [Rhodocyclaceae bacterium SMB388]
MNEMNTLKKMCEPYLMRKNRNGHTATVQWHDGVMLSEESQEYCRQFDERVSPVLLQLFDQNRERLPEKTCLYVSGYGGWYSCPRDIADQVESLVRAFHDEFVPAALVRMAARRAERRAFLESRTHLSGHSAETPDPGRGGV